MAFTQQFFKDLRTPLYKNSIHLMISTITGSVFGFLFWIVAARYYSAYEVGLAAVIIPLLGLIGVLSALGFEAGLVRFLPSSREDSRSMINTCFTITVLTAILVSSVFIIGLDIWSPALLFIRQNLVFLLCFVLFSVVFSLYPLMNQVFIARRDAKLVVAGRLIEGSKVLLLIVFASFLGAFGIFASWSLAMLIALLIGVVLFIPRVSLGYRPIPTVKMRVVNKMARFSMANYLASVFGMIPGSLLPLLVLNTLNAENVAYFYVAFTIAGFLAAIVGSVSISLFAEGSHFERELKHSVLKATKLIFVLLIPAVIVIVLLGDYVLQLFGSKYSTEGLAVLQILAVSTIFLGFNWVFMATRQVLKRMRPIVAIPVFNALSIIGLSYIFVLWMGVVGIAIAIAVSRGIVSAGIGVYLLRNRAIEGSALGD